MVNFDCASKSVVLKKRRKLRTKRPVQQVQNNEQYELWDNYLILELADGPRLGEAKRLGGLLHSRHHRRRSAYKDLDIGCRGGKECLK